MASKPATTTSRLKPGQAKRLATGIVAMFLDLAVTDWENYDLDAEEFLSRGELKEIRDAIKEVAGSLKGHLGAQESLEKFLDQWR